MRKKDEKSNVTEDITQTQKQKRGPADKEDSTLEKKKKAKLAAMSKGKGVVSPEVEKVVEKFVKHATESGIDALRAESKEVLEFKPSPNTYQKFLEAPQRNRFPEIQCLDETRVVIEQVEPNSNTYIHASKVKLDKADRLYILTQGPKENTIEDFWRMIFQEQCAGVVMLCNYYEDGMQKCDEYFPTESGAYKYYGKMFVNNKKVSVGMSSVMYTMPHFYISYRCFDLYLKRGFSKCLNITLKVLLIAPGLILS
ncbi:unnamed protein product [Nippostrongylus brasiliensis]|uniref:Tyrosine-protein phosphatase domain-containing protein n=1 Tax=Nippostrongylus brasiliensis TaxID=27835 RepID=A0A0N4XKN0_NIPBR|nr:unnamed protein product [Nippostrongylus brasiliensis]